MRKEKRENIDVGRHFVSATWNNYRSSITFVSPVNKSFRPVFQPLLGGRPRTRQIQQALLSVDEFLSGLKGARKRRQATFEIPNGAVKGISVSVTLVCH